MNTPQTYAAFSNAPDADPQSSFALPAWTYTDPEIYEREKREIFYRTWHYAGHRSQLAEPGSYVTAVIVDEEVVVVRGHDGVLRGDQPAD